MFIARSFYPVPVFQNDQCQPTALVFATQCRMLIRDADLSFPNYFFIQNLKPVLISPAIQLVCLQLHLLPVQRTLSCPDFNMWINVALLPNNCSNGKNLQ